MRWELGTGWFAGYQLGGARGQTFPRMGSQQPEACVLGSEGQHGQHHMFSLFSQSTQAPSGVVLRAACCTAVTGEGDFTALPNSRVVYQLLFPPLFSSVVPGPGASGWLGVFWSGMCKAVSLYLYSEEGGH